MTLLPVAVLLLATAAPSADPAPQACPAGSAPLPAALAGWSRATPVRAGAVPARAAELAVGEGAAATLLPTPRVAYRVRPGKPGEPTSSGGLFAFTVAATGRYRVALGSGAWVDVLSGTTPVASAAHGHGPACSGVRKTVDFDLTPGRYLLQVAGNAAPTLPLMVARVS